MAIYVNLKNKHKKDCLGFSYKTIQAIPEVKKTFTKDGFWKTIYYHLTKENKLCSMEDAPVCKLFGMYIYKHKESFYDILQKNQEENRKRMLESDPYISGTAANLAYGRDLKARYRI